MKVTKQALQNENERLREVIGYAIYCLTSDPPALSSRPDTALAVLRATGIGSRTRIRAYALLDTEGVEG